jgi:hypothetical protein
VSLNWLLSWNKCKQDNLQPGNVVLFFDHFPSVKEMAHRILELNGGEMISREEFDNLRICVTRSVERQ